jgi:hypothetical protein
MNDEKEKPRKSFEVLVSARVDATSAEEAKALVKRRLDVAAEHARLARSYVNERRYWLSRSTLQYLTEESCKLGRCAEVTMTIVEDKEKQNG